MAAAEAVPNDDPSFLQVYDANVENLPTTTESCPGDWHDLMYYMRLQEYRPDIYLVQQISNREQLDLLLTRMKEHFGESMPAVLAEDAPKSLDNGCAGKKQQTNGIIWRTDRLSLKTSASPDNRWQAQRETLSARRTARTTTSRGPRASRPCSSTSAPARPSPPPPSTGRSSRTAAPTATSPTPRS